MELLGRAAIAVTATPQRVAMQDAKGVYTLQNKHASGVVYFKYEPGTVVTAFAGNDAALLALSAGKIDAGDTVVIGPGIPYIDVVCATGLTSTLEIEPGVHGDAANADLSTINTNIASLVTLLGVGTGAMASAQAVTIATDDTVIGATDAAVVAAGAVGSVSAKLRRLTTDVDALKTLLAVGTGAMASAQAVTIATDDTVIGATTSTKADVDGNGAVNAHLRRIGFEVDRLADLVDAEAGGSLTYTSVPIDLAAGGAWKDLGAAGAGTKVRLHELVLSFIGAGTWRLCSDDDGAGTNAVDLMGATMYCGANGTTVIPWVASQKGRPECPNSKHLSLYSSVACDGRAVTTTTA